MKFKIIITNRSFWPIDRMLTCVGQRGPKNNKETPHPLDTQNLRLASRRSLASYLDELLPLSRRCNFSPYRQDREQWIMPIITSIFFRLNGPIGWGSRIHRLHLYRGVRLHYKCPGYDTKQSDGKAPIMLGFEERRLPLYCHRSHVHSGLEW